MNKTLQSSKLLSTYRKSEIEGLLRVLKLDKKRRDFVPFNKKIR